MWTPTWVIGYHGCDHEVAEAVLSGTSTLKVSSNDYDWLGTGIYFWENDPERALGWARFVRRHPESSATRIRTPSLVGAVIDLGHCLDLLEADSIRLVQRAHLKLKQLLTNSGIPLPRNSGSNQDQVIRRLDCAVINYLHELREAEGERAFDSIRAPFIEGARLYENAGFHARTHLQLCIRREAQIVGYFRVRSLTRKKSKLLPRDDDADFQT